VGAILAVAFVLINVVADKLRLWSGIAWIIVAGIIITLMLKGKEPGDEFRVLITVFAFLASGLVLRCSVQKREGRISVLTRPDRYVSILLLLLPLFNFLSHNPHWTPSAPDPLARSSRRATLR
jgi:hypothetical protein